jgi:hypothetical protein
MSRKNNPITRRTVLRGLGAALGLPLLDAMKTVVAASPASVEASVSPIRLACLFFPNGVAPKTFHPKGVGVDFELSPTLSPLADFKDEILVLTNLTNKATDTGDGHYVKDAAFLTGTTIHRTTGADLNSGGISLDQLVARKFGHLTPLPSLELSVEPVSTGVDVAVGYTRIYGAHISWSSPTTPLARELNPKLAFDRLFRSSAGDRKGRIDDDRSVLDLVLDDAGALKNQIGVDDRRKIDEYLDSVRAVEKRIAFEASGRRAQYRDDPRARKDVETLGGRVDLYNHDPGRLHERSLDHTESVRLMLDLIVLAFQTDSTRVASFMFGNSVSNKNFSFLKGVKGGHHEMSHHQREKNKLEQYQRIGAWFFEQYAYMLSKMRAIKEGNGTLLDRSMVLMGSGLSDGNAHSPHDLPIVVAGRGGGAIATGRHLSYPKDTPLCGLYVSLARGAGVEIDRFADADGPLEGVDNLDYPPVDHSASA